MSIPTVNVTVVVNGQDGSPVEGAVITAKLDREDRYNGLVVRKTLRGKTDANGELVLALFPNALGTNSSQYVVSIQTKEGTQRYTAYVPNEDCYLMSIVDLEPAPALSVAQIAIRDANAARAAAEGFADDAKASAQEAAALASSASTMAGNAATSAAGAAAAKTAAEAAQGLAEAAQVGAEAARDDAQALVAAIPTVGTGETNVPTNAITDGKFVPLTRTVAGKALSADITLAAGDVGLGNVTNDAQVKRSEMGAVNGVPTLGSDGKVPTSQLPAMSGDTVNTQITNAGFGVWSNGTLTTIGTAVTVTNITSGVCTTTNTQGIAVGKLVKFSSGSNAAVASKVFEVTAVTANTSFTLHDTSISPGAVSSTSCNEATMFCNSGTTDCCDLWTKDSAATAWREQSDVKEGSLYALGLSNGCAYWSDGNRAAKPEFYKKYAGRAAAEGMWVKCSSASKARIGITDSAGTTWSSYHSGGGSYEWLEVTRTPDAGITSYNIVLDSGTLTEAKFSQPQLQFGTSIGQGNFVPMPNEVICLESVVASSKIKGSFSSMTSTALLNIEADSGGVLPKGCKRIRAYTRLYDSSSLSAIGGIAFSPSPVASGFNSTTVLPYIDCFAVSGTTNNYQSFGSVLIECNSDGDVYYATVASGTNTMNITFLNYTGVQL